MAFPMIRSENINAIENYPDCRMRILHTRQMFGVNRVGKNPQAHQVVCVKYSTYAHRGLDMFTPYQWLALSDEEKEEMALEAYGEYDVVGTAEIEDGFECVCGKKSCSVAAPDGRGKMTVPLRRCFYVRNRTNGFILAFGGNCTNKFFTVDPKFLRAAKRSVPTRSDEDLEDFIVPDDEYVSESEEEVLDDQYVSESESDSNSDSDSDSSQYEDDIEDMDATPPAPSTSMAPLSVSLASLAKGKAHADEDEVELPISHKRPRSIVIDGDVIVVSVSSDEEDDLPIVTKRPKRWM